MEPLRIFIGYDSEETVAFHVLSHSILRRASLPVAIVPLKLDLLRGVYRRERSPLESTEFSLTRFLVPYLCDYRGQAVFIDCDMLCRADIAELVEPLRFETQAVFVCQHDYTPKASSKFLGNLQLAYPRKNWSSLMVFNNARCRALTPDYVNSATGLQLHRFEWLSGDHEIGSLPLDWNHLVGEYHYNDYARMVHFTNGGPWFEAYRSCEYASHWTAELANLTNPLPVDVRSAEPPAVMA